MEDFNSGRRVWNIASANPRSHTLTGLEGGRQYEVQVKAYNAVGDSAWSTSRTATPTIGQPPTNRAPTFDRGQPSRPAAVAREHAGPDRTSALPVTATDPDTGDTLTYTLGRHRRRTPSTS